MASKGYPALMSTDADRRHCKDRPGREDLTIRHRGQRRRIGGNRRTGAHRDRDRADVAEARDRAYDLVRRVDWGNGFCRRDIGWRAIGARPDLARARRCQRPPRRALRDPLNRIS